MIEVRIDQDKLKKIKHDITANNAMVAALKAAGIPGVGLLYFRGIERGRLEWTRDVDLENDTMVMRWWDDHEHAAHEKELQQVREGGGDFYVWTEYELT